MYIFICYIYMYIIYLYLLTVLKGSLSCSLGSKILRALRFNSGARHGELLR